MYRTTVCVMAKYPGMKPVLVGVAMEIHAPEPERVWLTPIAGRNRSPFMHPVSMSLESWEDRPVDPYDSIVEARWALKKLGYSICT